MSLRSNSLVIACGVGHTRQRALKHQPSKQDRTPTTSGRDGRSGSPSPDDTADRARELSSWFRPRRGSPYVDGLIAEKQGFRLSMSESSSGELRHEEEVLQSESSDCDVATEFSEVVLVGLTDFLDDAVKAKSLEKT